MIHPISLTLSGMIVALAVVGAVAAQAATPASYAKLDRASAAACVKASALRNASAGPVTRFSDRMGKDARMITGVWPQPHMKAAAATMLCLYDRRTRRAEVQELAGRPATPAPPSFPAMQIKDRRWQVIALDGRPPVTGTAPVTLMFGSDGNIAANSGCNGFGGRYMLTGEGLKIYGPMIGTQMACAPAVMEQERRFQAILAAAHMLKPQLGGNLLLGAAGGRTIILSADKTAVPGEPMAFTAYRCGERTVAMNLSDVRAIVELDGERIELPNRSSGDPEAPRLFTNGRVTVFQAIEGPADRGVSLAIGRAATQRCEPVTRG